MSLIAAHHASILIEDLNLAATLTWVSPLAVLIAWESTSVSAVQILGRVERVFLFET